MALHTVFVDGAAGTTGLRIRERLAQQPDIHLLQLEEKHRKSLDARLEAIHTADLSILCLPDEAARQIAALASPDAKICDASTAHRTNEAWVYALPELRGRRQHIAKARRVSVPGCYATGFIALAAPLIQGGAIDPQSFLSCYGISGYSGGGKSMIDAYEHNPPPQLAAPRQYALEQNHKHLPEMAAHSGLKTAPLFSPIVAPYSCGMMVCIPLLANALLPGRQTFSSLEALYREYYADEPLITVHPAGCPPTEGALAANALAGQDNLEIWVLGNQSQMTLTARFDNLGKGSAGAAIQCMNLMLQRNEYAGLVWQNNIQEEAL